MDEDDILKMTVVMCGECGTPLDVLSGEKEVLYIDKKCECGSMNFFTIPMKIKILCDRPTDREPFFKWDGHEFYKK
jgi:hypothetical protein